MNVNPRMLQRSSANRMIGGVCGGIGEYANVDPTIVRLLTVLLFFLTGPAVILAYLVMLLIVPEASASSSS